MVETRILLSALWIATMLTYLLGDVLRIFAGDFEPGKLAGTEGTPAMFMLIAMIMLVPSLMVVLTLIIPYPTIRWISIIVAILVVIFDLIGLPYEGMYDNFLIVVSIIFNALVVWYAWQWAG